MQEKSTDDASVIYFACPWFYHWSKPDCVFLFSSITAFDDFNSWILLEQISK